MPVLARVTFLPASGHRRFRAVPQRFLLASCLCTTFRLSPAPQPFFQLKQISPSVYSVMDSSWDVDSSEGLSQLLSHVQVPETLQTALQQTGLSSISVFAYAYTSSEDLSTFVAKQSQSLWDDLQVTDPEHCPAVARLRRALDLSKAVTRAKDSHPSAAPASTATPPATNVWAEHAPPRLDADAVQRMQSTFKANYPGEPPGQRLHAKHPPAKHSAPLVRTARHHKMGSLATSHVATPVPGYNGGAHVPRPPHRGTVGELRTLRRDARA